MWIDVAFRALFPPAVAVASWCARQPGLGGLTRFLTRVSGALNARVRRARPQTTAAGLGEEWQRMFTPLQADLPIVSVDGETVLAEIHVACPLRGTGDVQACYRMMEYDRRMLEAIGGQMIILRSQAEPGVTVCHVALRAANRDASDLEPAHLRPVRPALTEVQSEPTLSFGGDEASS